MTSMAENSGFEDLPSVDDSTLGRRVGPLGRRSFLKVATAAGTAAGLWTVGLFRHLPFAYANPVPYTVHFGGDTAPCSNSSICHGAPYIDNGYCATCSDTNNTTNWFEWHFSGTRGSYQLGDRWPNVCDGNYDAWSVDTPGACLYCNPTQWRCHDGWKSSASTGFQYTICRGVARCNGVQYCSSGCCA